MTDPTAYHRKLAEAIWQGAWREGKCGDAVPQIAAVLAAEGVVDPKHWTDQLHDVTQDYEQQLAALRVKADDHERIRVRNLALGEQLAAMRAKVAAAEKAMSRWLKEYDHPMPSYFREARADLRTGDSDAK